MSSIELHDNAPLGGRASTLAAPPGRPFCLLALTVLLLVGSFAASAQAPTRKIFRFGDPRHAFSTERASTEPDLQRLVEKYEQDLRTQFTQAGWSGDPDAFFSAVESGAAEPTTIPVGERFVWMGFRRNGQPAVRENVEWAGSRPADAWQVEVTSGTTRTTFKLPAICLNLSLIKEEEDLSLTQTTPVEPPTCALEATASCDSKSLTIVGSGAGSIQITGLELDGRRQSLADLRSAGSGRWTLTPIANGTYTIDATTSRDGETGTCSTRVRVDCPVPVCQLGASYDPATRRIEISSQGSVGEVSLTGLTLPDGGQGDLSRVAAGAPGNWSYDPRRSLPRRTGDYVFSFTAEAELEGETATCSANATVPVSRPETRWTLRLRGGRIDADGGHLDTAGTRPEGAALGSTGSITSAVQVVERTRTDIGDGSGFGLDLEYRISPLIGIELSAFFGELDAGFVLDLDEEWGMDDDTVSYVPILLGANFHVLEPDGPVDLYIAPVLGLVNYGDATFRALGETFRRDFDNELAWGLGLGLDVPFSSRWLFTTEVQYLDVNAEVKQSDPELELKVDPITITAGLGIKF